MPAVDFDVRGAGKVAAEHKAIGKAAEQSAQKNAKLGTAWKANAKEMQKYDRLSQQIVRQNETAQERYNRKLRDAKRALIGNARESELLKRETARLKKEYDKQVASEKALHEGRKEAIDGATKATGKLATATGDSATALGKQGERFGAPAIKQIGKYAAAIGGVATAMRGISAVIGTVRENNEAAVASLERMEAVSKRINQVSFDASDLGQTGRRADTLAKTFGVDRDEVSGLLFAARSEGISNDTVHAILASSQTLDVPAATQVAGQIPKLFKDDPYGKINGRQALNATLRAARQSRLTFEEIGANAPRIAEGASLAGASLAETLAVEAVLSDRFASGSTTADRGKAFATKVGITEDLRGSGFLGAFRKIRDEYSPQQRKKFLGESQELNTFYQILGQEEGRVVSQTGSIVQAINQSGTDGSELAGALRRAQRDPKFSARLAKQQSVIELEVAREDNFATDEARRDAVQNRLKAEQIRQGRGATRQALVSGATGLFDLFNASPETVAAVGVGVDRFLDGKVGVGFSSRGLQLSSNRGLTATDEEKKSDSGLLQKLLDQTIETNRLLGGTNKGVEGTNRGVEELNLKPGFQGVAQ